MRLTIRQNGKVEGVWVARTKRGFNKRQRAEILATRKRLGLLEKESRGPKESY